MRVRVAFITDGSCVPLGYRSFLEASWVRDVCMLVTHGTEQNNPSSRRDEKMKIIEKS